MHLALYRKYRPKTFDEVIGQDNIVTTLKNQVIKDEISHAYLFTGSRGTGKTSCAKIFARAINCLHNKNGSPCGECEVCKGLAQVNNTDILEIDAASNNRVDEIRDLRESVKYPAIVGRRKVYIIDEVHMLTDSAFNALLKTLEEPPENVVFILCTTEMNKLPATILSRVIKFEFNLVDTSLLIDLLKRIFNDSNISYDEESLEIIATAGDGSVRDTLSIADAVVAFCEGKVTADSTLKIVGKSSIDMLMPVVKAIFDGDAKQVFVEVDTLKKSGKNINILLKDLCNLIKDFILIKGGIKDLALLHLTNKNFTAINDFVQNIDKERLTYAFNTLSSVEMDLKFSLDPQLLFESACIRAGGSGIAPTVVAQSVTPSQPKSAPVANESVQKRWGEVLLAIKDEKYFALASACKNIYKVEQRGEILYLYVSDRSSREILNDSERASVLLKLTKQRFENISGLQFMYDEDKKSSDDLIQDLRTVFPNNFKVE